MKIALKVIIVLLIIVGAVYWFFLRSDQDIYTLENAILIAEQGECAEYGTMINGTYNEDYGIWYLEIDTITEPLNDQYVYSCEVNAYTEESKVNVEKTINWYEDDVMGDPMPLTVDEAGMIALGSECAEQGELTGESMYNESTGTWWLDLEIFPEYENELCNPACVVYDSDFHAEINWRCTGLIVE